MLILCNIKKELDSVMYRLWHSIHFPLYVLSVVKKLWTNKIKLFYECFQSLKALHVKVYSFFSTSVLFMKGGYGFGKNFACFLKVWHWSTVLVMHNTLSNYPFNVLLILLMKYLIWRPKQNVLLYFWCYWIISLL